MEFVIYLQSIINSYGIFNLFVFNYKFWWNLYFYFLQTTAILRIF